MSIKSFYSKVKEIRGEHIKLKLLYLIDNDFNRSGTFNGMDVIVYNVTSDTQWKNL